MRKRKEVSVIVLRRLFNLMISTATAAAFGAVGWTIGIFIKVTTGHELFEVLVPGVFGVVGALIGARAVPPGES